MKKIKTIAFLIICFTVNNAFSQVTETLEDKKNKMNFSLGAGFAFIPEYEGSEDTMVIPFPVFSLDWNSGQYIRLVGLDIEANLLSNKHRKWELGPKLSFKPGRDDEVSNIDVANLEEIDFNISAGLFGQYKFAKNFDVKAEYTHDISGVNDGGVGALEIGYTLIKKKCVFRVAATSSYATDNYMNAYFGVNPNNIGTSLFSYYELESGIKDVGAKFNTTYFLNNKWILAGQIGFSELVGDVVDSPIVTSTSQFSGGVSAMYRF